METISKSATECNMRKAIVSLCGSIYEALTEDAEHNWEIPDKLGKYAGKKYFESLSKRRI